MTLTELKTLAQQHPHWSEFIDAVQGLKDLPADWVETAQDAWNLWGVKTPVSLIEPSEGAYRKGTVLALESQRLREGATLSAEQTRLLHAALGIATEAGELLDAIKKHLFYGKPLDFPNLVEESGDVRWYMEQLYDVLRTTDSEVRRVNTLKLLTKRYKKGQFEQGAALQRDLAAERQLLERETGRELRRP